VAVTLAELINNNNARPVRELYIKRKDLSGSYEADWVRIDRWKNKNVVVDWGRASNEADSDFIATFNISGINLIVDNSRGYFNSENDSRSIWSGYLNRQNTKIRIVTNYISSSDEEPAGTIIDFEGLLLAARLGDSQKATINCNSYQSVLQKYDIADLSLSGTQAVSTILAAILNQAKITTFFSYNVPVLGNDPDITAAEDLAGSYWSVIKQLCAYANSAPIVDGSDFKIIERTASVAIQYEFIGSSPTKNSNIYKVLNYDDEGTKKVRVFWFDTNSGLSATTTSTLLSLKYLDKPENINLIGIDTNPQKQNILDTSLAEWENPKPVMTFRSKYLCNLVGLFDRVTIEIDGPVAPGDAGIWDAFLWDDGTLWGERLGSINIGSEIEWKIIKIIKNIQGWYFDITVEQIV
jgi:hypothetical protein